MQVLRKYLEAEDPSVLVLTETKCSKGKPDILCLKTRFKYQFWGTDPQPGRAGTAILSKVKPINTVMGLPTWPEDPSHTAGRYVELEYEGVYIIGVYVPNSGDTLQNLDTRKKWNTALKDHLRTLDAQKPIICGGDFNCIMDKKDIDQTAEAYWDRMGGMSKQERVDMAELMKEDDAFEGFVDVWRNLHPEAEEYTHSSTKFGSWRLDSFIVSAQLTAKASGSVIRHKLKALNVSDHWPVAFDIELKL
ncbi:DNase I-like protein [Pluteus cervinus]|uniref:DNase I-like protein n=1 Tax=Pluteus cervinus TaxID=181527 RepID=A0ACD3BH27_9AGAR|nr:DNase I-like protein [Pluteus cervinus]